MLLVAATVGAITLGTERPRLFLEAADLPRLRDAWTARARASAELFRYCANRLDDPPGEWSGSCWPLEPARSLALVALLEGTCALDESPGGRVAYPTRVRSFRFFAPERRPPRSITARDHSSSEASTGARPLPRRWFRTASREPRSARAARIAWTESASSHWLGLASGSKLPWSEAGLAIRSHSAR